MKFANALNKLPGKLHVLTIYPIMEPILSTSHSICNGARSCAHALKTIPLAPIHLLIKQIIPSLYQQSSTWDSLQSIILIYHKCPTYKRVPFFFFVCFIFIVHFLWACENLHDFSFVHLSHSFFNRFQSNLCQHFSHVCSTCHMVQL